VFDDNLLRKGRIMLGTNGLFSSEYEGSLSNQEQAQRLFGQPDVLVVNEFLDVYQNRPALTPERRLAAAVLRDAIDCYMRFCFVKKGRGKRIFQETEQWFFAGEEDGVFTFENVCEILRLTPGYIRRGLLDHKQGKSLPADSRAPDPEHEFTGVDLRLAS
jgi:hypothetical protein